MFSLEECRKAKNHLWNRKNCGAGYDRISWSGSHVSLMSQIWAHYMIEVALSQCTSIMCTGNFNWMQRKRNQSNHIFGVRAAGSVRDTTQIRWHKKTVRNRYSKSTEKCTIIRKMIANLINYISDAIEHKWIVHYDTKSAKSWQYLFNTKYVLPRYIEYVMVSVW